MIIYSKTISAFLLRVKKEARIIMQEEMNLTLKRKRFSFEGHSYPLHFVCFEGRPLGYFHGGRFEIGLHKSLITRGDNSFIRNLLRHELAHLMCFLRMGTEVNDHGKEFRDICRSYGWTKRVWSASVDMESQEFEREDRGRKKIVDRVKKLLALAHSDNVHEAESATAKANQLLINHHLESKNRLDICDKDRDGDDDDEEICVHKILSFQRSTGKYQAIADILRFFYVYPVFNHEKGRVVLEVTGTREHVLIADYVAGFLNRELERLYKESSLTGISQKTSFMRGVSEGYKSIHEAQKIRLSERDQKAIALLQNDLAQKARSVYGRLSFGQSLWRPNEKAKAYGKDCGKKLTIRRGIEGDATTSPLLLG
ncbi:MAG: DUF2786 domain-containing protein [Bacteriovoracales bacterium]|nr:DUF2786 domain-containing protein [Bacteriovoracales bacterium]